MHVGGGGGEGGGADVVKMRVILTSLRPLGGGGLRGMWLRRGRDIQKFWAWGSGGQPGGQRSKVNRGQPGGQEVGGLEVLSMGEWGQPGDQRSSGRSKVNLKVMGRGAEHTTISTHGLQGDLQLTGFLIRKTIQPHLVISIPDINTLLTTLF